MFFFLLYLRKKFGFRFLSLKETDGIFLQNRNDSVSTKWFLIFFLD